MDDMMSGSMESSDSQTPLSTSGVDFNDPDQASEFLESLLDDTTLQVIGNAYARYFWYGVVCLVAVAALVNVIRRLTLNFRRRQAAKGQADSARPKNLFMKYLATATAISRETTYPQLTPVNNAFWCRIPPLGTLMLLAIYLGFVMVLEFISNDIQGAQRQQAFGVRAAWLAIAQIPLLILLIGKNNWIGFVTGISYERLNVLHRWVSRMLLLLATLHFGLQGGAWRKFPGIFTLEWTTDSCVPTGLATYVLLLWMNLSTLAPIRNLCYEFFIVQHIITFFGFIIAVMFHLPSTALYSRVYIYIPIGLYLFDRLVRFGYYAYINSRASRASLTALDGVTKIQLRNPRVKTWTPGAHVLISLPALGFGQSHPATIASTPQSHDGDIVLMLKSQRGFTKSMLACANDSHTTLLGQEEAKANEDSQERSQTRNHRALIDGPYGGKQADFAAFDSVCLIAGSTGITFVLPILLDIAYRASQVKGRIPLRRIQLVWCVKEINHAKWVQSELASAFASLRASGIESEVAFYITCADSFTASGDAKECPCECDKSLGPCCCINPEDIEREKEITDPLTGNSSTPQTIQEKTLASATAERVASEDAPCPAITKASVYSGRPKCIDILEPILEVARGETGVAVCGPLGLSASVRNAVVELSDRRAVHKGTGAQGIYLHVEGFGL